jgi:hypothetical protein
VVGSVVAAFVLLALAVALPGDGVSLFLLRLVELVLAGGAAYLLDDGAARMTVVTPWGVWRRRAPALAGGLTVLVAAWVVILLVLARQAFSLSAAVLSGELLVLGAIAVALSALLVWRGDPVPGSRVAPILALAGMTALFAEPLLRVSIFLAADGGRNVSGWLAWSTAGLLSIAVILFASRDPASRWRR